ncbi:hypothetical protein BGW39_001980 [Mortierella sp. 14UC]|nr:hypothetical protein BGW39_001980 [Mortierella sp. 14UC]
MTSTASNHFFQLPELLLKLATKLNKPTLATLVRTNRQLNAICTPFLYCSLDFSAVGPGLHLRLIDSVEAIEGHARNMHSGRELTSGPLFMGFYYNCLLAYRRLALSSSILPIMVQDVEDEGQIMLLGRTLAQMSYLKKLDLCVQLKDDEAWARCLEVLFFSCPSEGLEELRVRCAGLVESGYDRVPVRWCESEADEWVDDEEEEDEDGGVATVVPFKRRDGPLSRLRVLDLRQLESSSLEVVHAIFRDCPKLEELYVPRLDREHPDLDVGKVGRFIVEYCPRLRRLHRGPGGEDNGEVDEFLGEEEEEEVGGKAERNLTLQILRAQQGLCGVEEEEK